MIPQIDFNPYLMSADVFGKYYVGSNLQRKNDRRRKQLAKQQGRKIKR
jgi:hypothetical protein